MKRRALRACSQPASQLKRWRLAHDLTQQDLGDLLGRTQSWVSRVERGHLPIAALDKAAIARRLGVPVRDLFPIAELAEAS